MRIFSTLILTTIFLADCANYEFDCSWGLMSFSAAESFCNSQGSHLATISSSTRNSEWRSQIASKRSAGGCSSQDNFWIGRRHGLSTRWTSGSDSSYLWGYMEYGPSSSYPYVRVDRSAGDGEGGWARVSGGQYYVTCDEFPAVITPSPTPNPFPAIPTSAPTRRPTASPTICESGWTLHGTSCLAYVSSCRMRSSASSNCGTLAPGATLWDVTTEADIVFLQAYALSKPSVCNGRVWTGGYETSTNNWETTTGQSIPMSFLNNYWDANSPRGGDYKCLAVNPSSPLADALHDGGCTGFTQFFVTYSSVCAVPAPSLSPTPSPSQSPSQQPTRPPSRNPTKTPTKSPTSPPTRDPTPNPTRTPTKNPSRTPSRIPTESPTDSPSKNPTQFPSRNPSASPTNAPTDSPSSIPTKSPTGEPSRSPTTSPSMSPTGTPSQSPTKIPSTGPSRSPSDNPTVTPTRAPSVTPTTSGPTTTPTKIPTVTTPTMAPVTSSPTVSPTNPPSTTPTGLPTKSPTIAPSKQPSNSPSVSPTKFPSSQPTKGPSRSPSTSPSKQPSSSPSTSPSRSPSSPPSVSPSRSPSASPSASPSTSSPSRAPSSGPSRSPSRVPTHSPSQQPTRSPSATPSQSPTWSPSSNPTGSPTASPSNSPTSSPTRPPSRSPSTNPTRFPSRSPTTGPTRLPSVEPTANPSNNPSGSPSQSPSSTPTLSPSNSPSKQPSTTPTKVPTQSPTEQRRTVTETQIVSISITVIFSNATAIDCTPARNERLAAGVEAQMNANNPNVTAVVMNVTCRFVGLGGSDVFINWVFNVSVTPGGTNINLEIDPNLLFADESNPVSSVMVDTTVQDRPHDTINVINFGRKKPVSAASAGWWSLLGLSETYAFLGAGGISMLMVLCFCCLWFWLCKQLKKYSTPGGKRASVVDLMRLHSQDGSDIFVSTRSLPGVRPEMVKVTSIDSVAQSPSAKSTNSHFEFNFVEETPGDIELVERVFIDENADHQTTVRGERR